MAICSLQMSTCRAPPIGFATLGYQVQLLCNGELVVELTNIPELGSLSSASMGFIGLAACVRGQSVASKVCA
jgi:hypothetical protein